MKRSLSPILGPLMACLISSYAPLSNAPAAQEKRTNPGTRQQAFESDCLSTQEAEIVRIVNKYRVQNRFAPVQVSKSLVKVARLHASDLQAHRADQLTDALGMGCTMHSWSSHGDWTPGCYTSDHRNADLMRDKPREITARAYADVGYEIVYWRSGSRVTPGEAIDEWIRSRNHQGLLFETGKWAGIDFKVAGAAISENYVVLWFGTTSDPLGSLPLCDSDPP